MDKQTLLSPKDQIDVMLHEYDSIRSEVIASVSRQPTLLTIWVTLLLTFTGFASQATNAFLVVVLPPAILVLIAVEAARQYSLSIMCLYIKIIEKQVNEIAGKPLLLWEHNGSSIHFARLRVKSPTGKTAFNSNTLVTMIYPLTVLAMFSVGLYKGTLYIIANVMPYAKNIAAFSYVFIHLALLIFILFSRLVQEKKVFSIYEDVINSIRVEELTQLTSSLLPHSPWR